MAELPLKDIPGIIDIANDELIGLQVKINNKFVWRRMTWAQLKTFLNVTQFVFKHIPITGLISAPNLIEIIPGVANTAHVKIDGNDTPFTISAEGDLDVPNFVNAVDYPSLEYVFEIISEQQQQILVDFDNGNYPRVSNNIFQIKLYRSGFGDDYTGGGSEYYCTLKIRKL